MCLLPPSSVLSAPRTIQQCSQHDTTCVLANPTHMQYLLYITTCSPSSKLLCTKCPDVTACKLPYWTPHHCFSSHPNHANAIGVVTRHTAKFVTFSPVDSAQDRICILPWSLLLVPPPAGVPTKPCNSQTNQRRVALSDTEDNQSRTQGRRERKYEAYDKLPETANFHVADKYVSFTWTFCYLGSLINYSLHDDNDITARIASATAAMGALKNVRRTPHLGIYNKYLLF